MATRVVKHLTHEHELIRQVLGAFQRFLESPDASKPDAPEQASLLLAYFEEIVFLRHEEKEEVILLPELARSGMSWGEGALFHVREEHQRGRHLMESLKHGSRSGIRWTPDHLKRYRGFAAEWVEFLTLHMSREEAEVFPAAVELAPRSERWLEDFERIDREIQALRGSEELEAWASDFIAHYTVFGDIVAAE
jgi:hemerythrin-like domain-containing protein